MSLGGLPAVRRVLPAAISMQEDGREFRKTCQSWKARLPNFEGSKHIRITRLMDDDAIRKTLFALAGLAG